MRPITRPEFLDLDWGPDDLDAAAEFWLRLYEVADRVQKFGGELFHTTDLIAWGLPRAEVPAARDDLAKRDDGGRFGVVVDDDPDTIALRSTILPGEERPPAGLGLPLLAGPRFHGLAVEICFRAFASAGGPGGSATTDASFVVVGELRGGRVVVKSVWRAGPFGWEDRVMRFTPWVNEAAWRQEFERFRARGTVSAALAKAVFVGAVPERLNWSVVWLVATPFDRPRLVPLATRAALWSGGFAGLVGLGFLFYQWFDLLLVVAPVVIFAGLWAWFGFLAAKTEATLLFAAREVFRSAYADVAAGSRVVPADAPVDDNTPVRKFSADFLAAGAVRVGDFRIEPAATFGDAAYRVFRFDDGGWQAWVTVHVQTETATKSRTWPGSVSLLGHTFFAGGGRFATVTAVEHGFRRKVSGPHCRSMLLAGETDAAAFAARHLAAARRFATESGQTPLAVPTFAEYLRLQQELQAEDDRLRAANPYPWADHLHWYVQYVRREYRPPAD